MEGSPPEGVPIESEGAPADGRDRLGSPERPGTATGAPPIETPLLPKNAFWLRRLEFWRSSLARVEFAYCIRPARLCMSTDSCCFDSLEEPELSRLASKPELTEAPLFPTERLLRRALSGGVTAPGWLAERFWSWPSVEDAPDSLPLPNCDWNCERSCWSCVSLVPCASVPSVEPSWAGLTVGTWASCPAFESSAAWAGTARAPTQATSTRAVASDRDSHRRTRPASPGAAGNGRFAPPDSYNLEGLPVYFPVRERRLAQRLFEVGLEVLDVLESQGEPEEVLGYP